jgi:DNA-binding PadR family transcriptional regulator
VTPVFGHGRLRLYLLKLLDEAPRHGYDVIRELEDRFMGLYTPSAGTVYPRLARLESEGLVTHQVSEGRKVYQITDAGRAELTARAAELDDLEAEIAGSVRDFATEIRSEVRGSVKDLRAELKSAAKDMRRQARSEGRQARADAKDASGRGPEPRPEIAELERLAEWFRGEVRSLARQGSPAREAVDEVRTIVDTALTEVRRVLRG